MPNVSLDLLENIVSDNDDLDNYFEPGFEDQLTESIISINKILPKLSSNIRKVIELKFFHNYSRADISKEMNIPQDQVYTYQKRGIKYLKKYLNCTPH